MFTPSRRSIFQLLLGSAVLLVPFVPKVSGAESPMPMKKVLVFTKSSAFEHSAIREVNGTRGYALNVLADLGPREKIDLTFSKDGSLFTPEYLAQFDAFLFYTSGDLLAKGTDGNPPMTAKGKEALFTAIKNGKGFIGVHAASDTFHAGENENTTTKGPWPWRNRNLGDQADPFTQMVGGEFMRHDAQQAAVTTVVDKQFPGVKNWGESKKLEEEWYSLTDFAKDLHVILVMETTGMRGLAYQRANYPSTWAHMYGKGRVFYTALGHREDMWKNPLFQEILFGGVHWAVGDLEADVTPNIDVVTPNAHQLPPLPPVKP